MKASVRKLAYRIGEFVVASGIGRTKTYELIATGQLKTIKIGRCQLITAESAEALLSIPAAGAREAA